MTGKLICLKSCKYTQACNWKNVRVEVIDLREGKFKLLESVGEFAYSGQIVSLVNHIAIDTRGLLLCQAGEI